MNTQEGLLDINELLARTDIDEATKRDLIISNAQALRVAYISNMFKSAFRKLTHRKPSMTTITPQVGQPN